LYLKNFGKRNFMYAIKFPVSKQDGSYLYMCYNAHGENLQEKRAAISRILSRDGKLDAHKMEGNILKTIRAWKIVGDFAL